MIENNVFVRNDAGLTNTMGGAASVSATDLFVRGNTFHRCSQSRTSVGGSGIFFSGAASVTLENNVFTSNEGGAAVGAYGGVPPLNEGCNIFWDNEGGNILGVELDESDSMVDPLYCDADNYDLTVASLSACLPGNSPGCGLIGALGQGCGAVSVEAMSWGQIKGAYR